MTEMTQTRIHASFLATVSIPGSLSRAVFVAALLLSAFALFRYWQSLDGATRKIRWLLIALRGAALLLLACALAGVNIEYESSAGGRVLVRQASAVVNRVGGNADATVLDEQQAAGIISALKQRSLSVVEKTVESGTTLTTEKGDFVAGILLTDGAMRADEAALEVERMSAGVGGVPVFVVSNTQSLVGPTVALESVSVGSQPVRGVPFVVRCAVHGRGMSGRESLVTIADESQVRASARVAWMMDDEWRAVELEVVPKVGGLINYTARVEAAGSEDMNLLSRPLSLYVEERRWRVLFFEGEPTWEAKFVRRALERSRLFEVDYFAQVSRAAAIGATEKTTGERDDTATKDGGDAANVDASKESKRSASDSPEAKLHGVLGSVERLNSYDCIIVGATPNEMLSAAEAARLSVWMERRGGGLIVLGGNSFAGSIVAPNGKLYKLMPAAIDARGFASEAQQLARSTPLEAEKNPVGVMIVPTAEGAGAALGGYLSAVQGRTAKADVLTGQGLRLGALRPGASVLAVAGRGSVFETSEAGTPLIAAARYGAGRTLLFAPADSWRLRTSANNEQDETNAPYDALWQGLTLWATAGAKPPVEISLSDESPAAGQSLTAEIRVRDATFAPAKIERLNARLQALREEPAEPSNENTSSREVAFVPDETDASIWRASFKIDAPGQYALAVDYDAGGKSGSVSKNFAVVAANSSEPGAADDTLRRAARDTGGDLLSSEDAAALVEKIAATPFTREKTLRTLELRAWWPLAFIIPLLLSAAWLIERMRAE